MPKKAKYQPECLSNVSAKQWKKWTFLQQCVFNDLYCFMVNNQKIFLHPKVIPLEAKLWKTTAHNAAWEAAVAVKDGIKQIQAWRIL